MPLSDFCGNTNHCSSPMPLAAINSSSINVLYVLEYMYVLCIDFQFAPQTQHNLTHSQTHTYIYIYIYINFSIQFAVASSEFVNFYQQKCMMHGRICVRVCIITDRLTTVISCRGISACSVL